MEITSATLKVGQGDQKYELIQDLPINSLHNKLGDAGSITHKLSRSQDDATLKVGQGDPNSITKSSETFS